MFTDVAVAESVKDSVEEDVSSEGRFDCSKFVSVFFNCYLWL